MDVEPIFEIDNSKVGLLLREMVSKGTVNIPNWMNFRKNSAFDPPPSFSGMSYLRGTSSCLLPKLIQKYKNIANPYLEMPSRCFFVMFPALTVTATQRYQSETSHLQSSLLAPQQISPLLLMKTCTGSHLVYCSTCSPKFSSVKLPFCINFMLKNFPKSAT